MIQETCGNAFAQKARIGDSDSVSWSESEGLSSSDFREHNVESFILNVTGSTVQAKRCPLCWSVLLHTVSTWCASGTSVFLPFFVPLCCVNSQEGWKEALPPFESVLATVGRMVFLSSMCAERAEFCFVRFFLVVFQVIDAPAMDTTSLASQILAKTQTCLV